MKLIILLILAVTINQINCQSYEFQIARVKYDGGSDWYNDPSAEINLLSFVKKNTDIDVNAEYTFVSLDNNELYDFPMLFITGHGNIRLGENQITRIKKYLERGGFIYVDDDYGFDKNFRRELKKIFPENDLIELPFDHPIYHCYYEFNAGPPKIHEHDNKPPQGFGLFIGGRLALYYTYESNPSDGWADQKIHNNSEKTREKALKFGTNIIVWALTN